ncbi:MAG: YigZ family protein [Clostridia bacterium]|nr:YigZ family protein [Clostridia bacterium]
MQVFNTIKENTQYVLTEKKSKFIANLIKIESLEEAEDVIKKYKKQYHDARHNCIAYRVLENNKIIEKSSDDGEPSGTAGAPMLNILQKNNLCNILIIVTRYFGGILLGTGGLVRAYSDSLSNAIELATKVEQTVGIEMEATIDYAEFEKFQYYCRINNIEIKNTKYLENIICRILMQQNKKDKLLEDFQNKSLNLIKLEDFGKTIIAKSKLN